jgi:hypothetical protein
MELASALRLATQIGIRTKLIGLGGITSLLLFSTFRGRR